MKHKLWSGLTAIMLMPTLSISSSSHAESLSATDLGSKVNLTPIEDSRVVGSSTHSPVQSEQPLTVADSSSQAVSAVKVGEYQSQADSDSQKDVIAKIKAHPFNENQAATLYVRNIPILTFVKAKTASNVVEKSPFKDTDSNSSLKVASSREFLNSSENASPASDQQAQTDPVNRAAAVAALLNQLSRDSVDANTIKVRWDENRQLYVIEVNGQELVTVDSETILPDTTNDSAEDALQATNRLRRQMGGAAPLNEIEGKPEPEPEPAQVTWRSIYQQIKGWASWYGPGFDGNLTASGETFDQYELTAAHPSLPFGTMVRVTNQDNGKSIVVRINDRGPYVGDRVIDLSKGAAQALGMIGSGVAPVQVDVLSPVQ